MESIFILFMAHILIMKRLWRFCEDGWQY